MLDIRIYKLKGSRFRETGILDVETSFKPTNTVQCLHFSSFHPKMVFKGLEKGKALQFLRSNSSQDKYERTISTFWHHLLCMGYLKGFVDSLLSTVLYSFRNKYTLPLISTSPLAPSYLTSSLRLTYSLCQTLTHPWDLISKDKIFTQLFSMPQIKGTLQPPSSARTLGRPLPPTTNVLL